MKKTLRGSYTVETAAIMPVLLLVLIASITLTFYFYDKCILAGMSGEAAVAAAEQIRNGEEECTVLEHKFQAETKKRLILLKQAEVQIQEKGTHVIVNIQASKGLMKAELCGASSVEKPEEYIRICRGLSEYANGN